MKKVINSKTIPFVVIISSMIGLALRWWTIGSGPDAFGLYPDKPLAWGALWLFTAVVAAMIILAVRPLKTAGSYQENYPKSVPGMVGNILAGGCVLFYSMPHLGSIGQLGIFDLLTVLGGTVAGAFLILLGVYRFLGKKPNFLFHGLICLYLAVRMFNRCRVWSDEPQTGVIVLPFLASMVLMLASYQRTCFDVELGNRRHSLLWSLLGAYLCILAMLSFEEEIFFYGGWALWLLTNLCSLRPLKPKMAPEAEQAPDAGSAEATHAPEDMSMEELESWLENPEQK